MKHYNLQQCIHAISERQCFHARVENGAFEIKIEDYTPFVCTAIHNGHQLRSDLIDLCALSDAERLYEEDPWTADMIADMPIVIRACDSRYEYDLNRPPETCVYEEAWGKPVWKSPLSEQARQYSRQKHQQFYELLGELYSRLEKLHGRCLVYDVHAYNYQRIEKDTPLFNIGTEQLDSQWSGVIQHWLEQLNSISLPDTQCRAAIDEVFYGRGYQATFVRQRLQNTLVLPTEIKKVYMDESRGTPRPEIIQSLSQQLARHMVQTADYFSAYTLTRKMHEDATKHR